MATVSHIPSTALDETFQKPLFSKEVEGWLGRATPADRERFEKVFESIRSISESKKAPDAHAHFVQSTLSKIRDRSASVSASAGAKVPTPPLARGSPAVVCNGWSYTATRAAFERPETRTALTTLQEQAAAQHTQQLEQQQRQVGLLDQDRPQSAPGAGAADSNDRELAAIQQAASRRRALSFGVTSGISGCGGGGEAGAASSPHVTGDGAGFVPISLHPTRYQETYNLRSCYPEIYDQALQDTKVEPPPNLTFISEWGNSLKSGSEEAAKMYMRTTYNTVNDEVVKLKTDADATREREFFKWMQKQKSFYGDLLSKAKAKDLEAVLAVATDEQKHEILQALRTAHAAVDNCFDRTRSHSQAVHCDMRRVEDEKTEAMRREHNKVRTMGQPLVRHDGPRRRPATAMSTASNGAAELKPATVNLTLGNGQDGADGDGTASTGGASRGGVVGGKALKPTRRPATAGAVLARSGSVPPPLRAEVDKMDTFRSRVPLTWPSGSSGPNISCYVEMFGGAKIGANRVRPNSALFKVQPIKYNDTTCPYGAVNPHTAAAPFRTAYPVPEGFTPAGVTQFPQPMGNTTYRNEFAPRDPADVAAQTRAANALVENSRKLLDRGSIPMGPRTGVNILPSAMWASETKDQFVRYDTDPREPYERAKAMRNMFMGPTGSGGKVTLGHGSTRAG